MQKVTSKEIPNLDKVPKDSLDALRRLRHPVPRQLGHPGLQQRDGQRPAQDARRADHLGQEQRRPVHLQPARQRRLGRQLHRRACFELGIPQDQLSFFQTAVRRVQRSRCGSRAGRRSKTCTRTSSTTASTRRATCPVLQTLGKGSISMAPVWSDQSLSYLAQKLLPPEVKLTADRSAVRRQRGLPRHSDATARTKTRCTSC